MTRFIRWLQWWKWFLSPAYKYGDPHLGQGETRQHNRNILNARHDAKEPPK